MRAYLEEVEQTRVVQYLSFGYYILRNETRTPRKIADARTGAGNTSSDPGVSRGTRWQGSALETNSPKLQYIHIQCRGCRNNLRELLEVSSETTLLVEGCLFISQPEIIT